MFRKAFAFVLLVFSFPAAATLLYDNGQLADTDLGLRYNSGQCTAFDDFYLPQRSVVTGFGWSQFDDASSIPGTVLTFGRELGVPLISYAVDASRRTGSRW